MSVGVTLLAAAIAVVGAPFVLRAHLRSRARWQSRFDSLVAARFGNSTRSSAGDLVVKGTWNGVPAEVRVRPMEHGHHVEARATGLPDWLEVNVGAAVVPWRAVMNEEQRAAIARFAHLGGTISGGTALQTQTVMEPGFIPPLLDDCSRVAAAVLADVPDLCRALVARLTRPPDDAPGIFQRSTQEDSERRVAFVALATLWPERLDPLLPALLIDPDLSVRAAAAGRANDAAVLREIVRIAPDASLARTALPLVAEVADDLLVDRWSGLGARVGTANLMAAWGARRSVSLLVTALESPDAQLSAAAGQALAQIRSRLGDVEVGQVSLAAEGGEVSVAASGGELSE